jgi:hypothetical protein
MLTVPEAAAGEKDRQIARRMAAGVGNARK